VEELELVWACCGWRMYSLCLQLINIHKYYVFCLITTS
jgi:hypothetical protein